MGFPRSLDSDYILFLLTTNRMSPALGSRGGSHVREWKDGSSMQTCKLNPQCRFHHPEDFRESMHRGPLARHCQHGGGPSKIGFGLGRQVFRRLPDPAVEPITPATTHCMVLLWIIAKNNWTTPRLQLATLAIVLSI